MNNNKKNIIAFEVKTACGKPEFKKSAKLVVYAPAPQTVDICNNTFVFTRDCFMDMIDSYAGNMLHSRTGNIQSFHWIDCTGKEYRPSASKKIERHIQSYIECAPTLADLLDTIGIDTNDFESVLDNAINELSAKRDHGKGYDGLFGEALEVTIKRHLMKRSKYLDRKTPSHVRYGDAQMRINYTLEELIEELGIE